MSTTDHGPGAVRDRRRVDAPLEAPTSHGGLVDVVRQRYLLRLLVRREISARYQGSALGLLWSYVNPLSQFLIYYVVIGLLLGLHEDVPNFAIHMFCGIIIVHFFNETFNAGTRSIVRNKSLVRRMALPREMFPVASMLVSAYHVLPQLVILLVACVAYGWTPDPAGAAALVLALAIIMTLGTALALVFSAANVFFRDFSNVVNILTNLVRFGVPMIYPYSLVEERLGPSRSSTSSTRSRTRCCWSSAPSGWGRPDPELTMAEHIPDDLFAYGLGALAASLVALVLAQIFFSKFNDKLPERL